MLTDEHDGLLTESGKLDDFCEAIKTVMNNPNLATDLGNNAQLNAQEYTWDSRCQSILTHLLGR